MISVARAGFVGWRVLSAGPEAVPRLRLADDSRIVIGNGGCNVISHGAEAVAFAGAYDNRFGIDLPDATSDEDDPDIGL